jgi:hypothetical protein
MDSIDVVPEVLNSPLVSPSTSFASERKEAM